MPGYAVEFTSENQPICGGRCKRQLGPTEEAIYLQNADPTRPGRKVCKECHQHYVGKATTRRINGISYLFTVELECSPNRDTDTGTTQADEVEMIRKQVTKAQRG
jgi:hypothetical protein